MKEETMKLPDNPFNGNTQVAKLYRRLQHYPEITRKEIHQYQMDTARIREIRGFLRQNHMDIKCEFIPGVTGDRLYSVVGTGR
jgi:hypothetical protein